MVGCQSLKPAIFHAKTTESLCGNYALKLGVLFNGLKCQKRKRRPLFHAGEGDRQKKGAFPNIFLAFAEQNKASGEILRSSGKMWRLKNRIFP
jgi:hypothetical protein